MQVTLMLICIRIFMQDRGMPPKSTNTTVRVTVLDNDDLSPKFTKGVYRTKITEAYPLTVSILFMQQQTESKNILRFLRHIFFLLANCVHREIFLVLREVYVNNNNCCIRMWSGLFSIHICGTATYIRYAKCHLLLNVIIFSSTAS